MRHSIPKLATALLIFGWLVFPAYPILAQANAKDICEGAGGNFATGSCVFDDDPSTLEGRFGNIVNALLFIVGAIAVLMIVIASIRFAVSGGDPEAAKGARNTILYAVIAVVVALLAYALIKFVIGAVGRPPTT